MTSPVLWPPPVKHKNIRKGPGCMGGPRASNDGLKGPYYVQSVALQRREASLAAQALECLPRIAPGPENEEPS